MADELEPAQAPGADPDGWVRPEGHQIPEWSPETLKAFEPLTPLERAFVEWFTVCNQSQQAWRKATGRLNEDNLSRNNSYCIRHRPRVKAAIELALKDRAVGPLMDRSYKLTLIREKLEQFRESPDPKLLAQIPKLVKLAAELQGEIIEKKEVAHHGLGERSNISVFISQIVAEAKGLIPGAEAPDSRKVRGKVKRTPPAALGSDQRPAGDGVAE